ncbi:MAG: prolipoprotein diacylglyceryl transferase [Mollicutes bacterium]|nr:prolipoprotein diacylglyceryl transferase [Mollicutes bacterium]
MQGILFDFGIIKIYWYSVIMFIAFFIGGSLALHEAKKWKIPEDFMINLFFFLFPLAAIGARAYFVAFNWSYYSQNINEIFKIWEGGLAIHGGMIVGLIWIILYSKKYKVNTWRLLDIIVVSLLISQAIGRWGNFFNKEAYGPATTYEFLKNLLIPEFIIEGMKINGIYYQPTFLYESIWCFIGFVLILLIRRYKYIKIGQITSFYLMWYGFGRFFIESLRQDSLMLNNFKMAQIISVIMFVVGIIVFFIRKQGSKFENQYNDKENVNVITF